MENSLPHLLPHYLMSMPWSLEKIVQFQELHLYGWAIHLSDFFQLQMFHLVDIHVLWGAWRKIAEFEEQWINAHTNISVACCGQQTREVCPYLVMWACQQLSSSHDPWMNHHLIQYLWHCRGNTTILPIWRYMVCQFQQHQNQHENNECNHYKLISVSQKCRPIVLIMNDMTINCHNSSLTSSAPTTVCC